MLERLINMDYKISDWYPSMDDALELTENPVENYEFLLWILESNPEKKLTDEQKEIRQILDEAIRDATVFTN